MPSIISTTSRIVCQYSCGAASAVATKLALSQYGATHDVQIVNAFIEEEHPNNRRFLHDCEHWFGRSITVLRDNKYGASTLEVWRRNRYLKGLHGAPCSRALKRIPLQKWAQADDIMVFGFTVEESDRHEDMLERHPSALAPLIDKGLSKADCLAMLERAGIAMPVMYRLGYENANCIGCVKGGQGYWNRIRVDFPERFEAIARLQDEIGPLSGFFVDRQSGSRMTLRQLPKDAGRHQEPMPSCSFFCEIAEQEYGA